MGSGPDDTNRLARRDFIKLGTSSLAVTLAACTSAPVADDEAAPAMATDNAGPMSPPDIGAAVDPSELRFGNWQEPWVWRPETWPGDPLELNVVANQSPGHATSPGNPTPSLFSYNGSSPGPTVRVRSDGEVRFRVRNTLGIDLQQTPVGPYPDPIDITPDTRPGLLTGRSASQRWGPR